MAITKLPRSGFADSAVTSAKVADTAIGTNEIPDSEITSAKLADDAVTNAKLSNSAITIRGTSVSLGGSHNVNVDIDWQTVKTGNTTMVAFQGYFVDTSSSAITMTLPSSASAGDTIAIKDYAGTFATNNCTIGRNGHNIQGVANDSRLDTNRASVLLVYVDSTKGWLYILSKNVGDLEAPSYVTATGGTILTSGDFKTHVFTGDGNFVVSNAGNSGGSNTVDYFVIAGGGAGSGNVTGGGGAGGFRISNSLSLPSPTTSPLANPSGLSVPVTTYPITVGGGASANYSNSVSGSNSIFSTITSAGGGGGGKNPDSGPPNVGTAGGSGGGGNRSGQAGGSGNTPPVSPSQGNNGGAGYSGPGCTAAGGGGGGAGAVGAANPDSPHGPTKNKGGDGSYIADTFFGPTAPSYGTPGPVGSTRYFSGGGGGGYGNNDSSPMSSGPEGGKGGGGIGSGRNGGGGDNFTGTAGSTNTGGGGGGSRDNAGGFNGGSGIVFIRYKYQN